MEHASRGIRGGVSILTDADQHPISLGALCVPTAPVRLLQSPRAVPGATRRCGPRADAGFVTPLGWIYVLVVVSIVIVGSWFALRLVASAHTAVAQRVSTISANAGASLGLDFLLNGTDPISGFPVILLPTATRQQAVVNFVSANRAPGPITSRYLAPLQSGDVFLNVGLSGATLSVTARAGRNGQFVTTATRTSAVLPANWMSEGRILETDSGRFTAGVLPLAIDLDRLRAASPGLGAPGFNGQPSSQAARNEPAMTTALDGSTRVPLQLGKTMFSVTSSASSDSFGPGAGAGDSSLLLAATEFLGYDGGELRGAAPPEFSVGQRIQLSAVEEQSKANQPGAEIGENGAALVDREGEGEDPVVASIRAHLTGRNVVVPVVRGNIVRGFAVATVIDDQDGLALRFMPSTLSPLARYRVDGDQVDNELIADGIVALGFAPPSEPEENFTDTVLGDPAEVVG